MVEVRRLDELITEEDVSHPILMKIDVQGAELDVLRGASGLLDAVREILVECSLVELYAGSLCSMTRFSLLESKGSG